VKKFQLRSTVPATVPAILIFSLISVSSCFADTSVRRSEASAAVARVQQNAPPASLYAEYSNIMETFSQAEELIDRNGQEEAEKLFQLVILKSSLYEKELEALRSVSIAAAATNATGLLRQGSSLPNSHQRPDDLPNAAPATPPPVKFSAEQVPAAATSTTRNGDYAGNTAATSRTIIGKKSIYTVRKGDTLRLIGAKFGVNWRLVAQQNRQNPKKPLRSGQKLTINTRRIVPKTVQEGIVINIPDRTLYLFKNRKLEKALPVGLGMTKWNDMVTWQTPIGKFRVLSKIKNPAWHVPVSIQKKMKGEGKEVKTVVPPGDDNPLGKYALRTSLPGILIHSTIIPESVYTFSSHGCIRVLPGNMEDIFNAVPVNTSGEIIYQPVKFALADDGRVFLEVHRDIYDRYKNLQELTKSLIISNNAESKVDWNKVNASLRRKAGFPEEITRTEQPQPMMTSENRTTAGIPAIP
jgi:L,D-transpeptidase ErfK/SrfK